MKEGEEDGDKVVGKTEQPRESCKYVFYRIVDLNQTLRTLPGGEEVVELAAQGVPRPGHVANLGI